MASSLLNFLHQRRKAIVGAVAAAATAWAATGSLDWNALIAAVVTALGVNFTPNRKA